MEDWMTFDGDPDDLLREWVRDWLVDLAHREASRVIPVPCLGLERPRPQLVEVPAGRRPREVLHDKLGATSGPIFDSKCPWGRVSTLYSMDDE